MISIIHGLNKGDRVSIILAADPPIPLIAELTNDLDYAMATVKAQEFRYTPSSLNEAAAAAMDSITASPNERELFIVTDGQASAWSQFQIKGNVTTFACLLGSRAPVNTAPVSVEVQPPLIMADTSPELLVTIGHTGPAQQTSVALDVDGREVIRRSADLGVDGGYHMPFSIPAMTPGIHTVRIRTSDDALMVDNDFLLLLKVREDLPILVAGAEPDAFFLQHALTPSEKTPVRTKRIDPGQLAAESLQNYPCVFLANALPLPGQAVARLEDYVRQGGVLAIFPGDGANPSDYTAFSCLPAQVDRVIDTAAAPERQSLVLLDPLDPLFAGLKMPPGVSPAATVQRRLAFGKLNPDAKALIGASSENPFLLSRPFGAGRVLLFSLSADRRWSDLPLSPFFLPLLHQTVRLACGLGMDRFQVQPAASFDLSEIIAGDLPDNAALIGPGDVSLPIRKVQKTGREGDYSLLVDHLEKPGYYTLAGQSSPLLAVNVDRSESDLKPVAPDAIPKSIIVSTSTDELLRQVQQHRVGRPLSELALWIALALSALELFVANRACRRRATLSETISINASGRVLTA